MEITPAAPGAVATAVTGGEKADQSTWTTHYFDATNATDEYWTWTTGEGASTVYMPTFNMNKDGLEDDINGTYAGPDGDPATDEDRYDDYVTYEEGDTLTDTEIYDADANDVDEYVDGSGTVDTNWVEVEVSHEAKTTGVTAEFISMQEWIDGGYGEGAYWVYDTDGWVYWAQPIASGETTGLLLDKIELAQVMDDSWYYGINVVAQFITADDLGKADGTGFSLTSKCSLI